MPEPNTLSTETLLKQAKKVRANKKLGQNFFVDANQLHEIVSHLDAKQGDSVIEIGSGLGFLTRVLSATDATIFAIELDRYLANKLENQALKGVSVVNSDFLDLDLSTLTENKNFKVIGNIPYQITSPIIARLFGEIGRPSSWLPNIERVILTMQKEVAQRLVAVPGTKAYSQITLLKNYYFNAEIILNVPPESFYPIPNVDSATVLLTPLKKAPIKSDNLALLKKTITFGFKQRRKMLKNNLTVLGIDETTISKQLMELKVNPHCRAENLSLEQFNSLANKLNILIEK